MPCPQGSKSDFRKKLHEEHRNKMQQKQVPALAAA